MPESLSPREYKLFLILIKISRLSKQKYSLAFFLFFMNNQKEKKMSDVSRACVIISNFCGLLIGARSEVKSLQRF